MSQYWYTALIEQNKQGRFFAHIPDLPGVTAGGGTIKEALSLVSEFADDHARDWVESGRILPPPRDLLDIEHDPEVKEFARAVVPVNVPGESTKISISIDKALLQSADRAAAREGLTRSGYIAAAIGTRMRGGLRRPISAGNGGRMLMIPIDGYDKGSLLVDLETNRAHGTTEQVPKTRSRKG